MDINVIPKEEEAVYFILLTLITVFLYGETPMEYGDLNASIRKFQELLLT